MMYWQQKEIDFVVIEMRRYVRDIKLWKTPEKSIETPWKIDFRNEEHLSAGFHAAVQNLEKKCKVTLRILDEILCSIIKILKTLSTLWNRSKFNSTFVNLRCVRFITFFVRLKLWGLPDDIKPTNFCENLKCFLFPIN